MGFIDEQRSVSEKPIKPRRTKGTVAHKARNKFATAVILGGSLLGLAWMYSLNTHKIREAIISTYKAEPNEADKRRQMMTSFGGKTTSADIDQVMKDLGRDKELGMSGSTPK